MANDLRASVSFGMFGLVAEGQTKLTVSTTSIEVMSRSRKSSQRLGARIKRLAPKAR